MPIFFLFTEARNKSSNQRLGVGPSWQGMIPAPAAGVAITGISRDNTGAPLGGCTCTLFEVDTSGACPVFRQVGVTVSDGGGNYSFPAVGFDGPYRVTFDLAGAPLRAGISLPTLSGV